jgi:hypothetical protein
LDGFASGVGSMARRAGHFKPARDTRVALPDDRRNQISLSAHRKVRRIPAQDSRGLRLEDAIPRVGHAGHDAEKQSEEVRPQQELGTEPKATRRILAHSPISAPKRFEPRYSRLTEGPEARRRIGITSCAKCRVRIQIDRPRRVRKITTPACVKHASIAAAAPLRYQSPHGPPEDVPRESHWRSPQGEGAHRCPSRFVSCCLPRSSIPLRSCPLRRT